MNATWSIVLTFLGLLATAIGAGAALGSWRAARRSDQAATTLANIERDRWHAELSPRFEITCYRATTGNRADLRLTFTGPSALDRLDGVTVTVRDDRTNRTSVTMGGPSDEELARVVWGPYRFVPGVNGADALGKAIPNFSLDRQETARLALEESLAPRWVSDHSFWRQQYADHPLRLMIICTRAGHKPWNVIVDVPIEPESTTQAR